MAGQLGLDFCIDARLNRISHAFRPLSFTGFNEAFAPDAQGAEQEYCRSIRATEHPMAQVALFTLKRSKDLNAELLVNWRARSISRSWEIRMVVPRAIDEDTPAFVGRLDADLITLRDASFVPGSTELHVRVCGIPVARPAVRPGDETADERHRRFWRFVDLTEIEVLER